MSALEGAPGCVGAVRGGCAIFFVFSLICRRHIKKEARCSLHVMSCLINLITWISNFKQEIKSNQHGWEPRSWPGKKEKPGNTKAHCLSTVWFDFPRRGGAFRETTSKDRFRRALLLMKPAHTGHHPGAVPGFRPSPGNSEETTTRVLTEEISVLFRVPTWDPTHPGSPVSRALPGNTPTQGPTREGTPGFFLGGGGNPEITQVRT